MKASKNSASRASVSVSFQFVRQEIVVEEKCVDDPQSETQRLESAVAAAKNKFPDLSKA